MHLEFFCQVAAAAAQVSLSGRPVPLKAESDLHTGGFASMGLGASAPASSAASSPFGRGLSSFPAASQPASPALSPFGGAAAASGGGGFFAASTPAGEHRRACTGCAGLYFGAPALGQRQCTVAEALVAHSLPCLLVSGFGNLTWQAPRLKQAQGLRAAWRLLTPAAAMQLPPAPLQAALARLGTPLARPRHQARLLQVRACTASQALLLPRRWLQPALAPV